MSWRPHGHVRVNSRDSAAAAICDRCGFAYNHRDLRWQWQYAGERLQNLRILVCCQCEDRPSDQLRSRVLSPDPLPIYNARPQPFTFTGIGIYESSFVFTADGQDMIVCSDGTTLLVCSNNPDSSFIMPVPDSDFNTDFSNDFGP